MGLNELVLKINDFVWGWPLIIYVVGAALIVTISLGFIQFRYFFRSWKYLLSPQVGSAEGEMTPLQAFGNALSTSLGNGSIAGSATAIYQGGPGAAVWIFVFGLLGMVLRFAEVYLATAFPPKNYKGSLVGGPMVYLSKVPGGAVLPFIYAFFMLLLGLFSGNAMQANSIRLGLVRILGVDPRIVAVILFAFVIYVMVGGAKRIVKISDAIVPIKVGLFFLTAFIVLGYHITSIIPALKTIFIGAFTPNALVGGAMGYAVQQAIRYGLSRTANASEAGLGTAAVLFGGSGTQDPVKSGIMSMASSFISANLVNFSIALMIVASGVWGSGLTSIDLTSAAYETVFGAPGGWIVTFLTMSFGLGVIVSYAYVCRACWMYLTDGRFMNVFIALFCLLTLWGGLERVDVVWNSIDIVVAGLLITNLYGILYLLPVIKKGIEQYRRTYTK